MKRTLIAILIVGVLTYGGDSLVLAMRPEPYGSVTVQTYYAVPKKNGKTEFMLLEPRNVPCVHSIFPHLGYSPCWYVARHSERRENI